MKWKYGLTIIIRASQHCVASRKTSYQPRSNSHLISCQVSAATQTIKSTWSILKSSPRTLREPLLMPREDLTSIHSTTTARTWALGRRSRRTILTRPSCSLLTSIKYSLLWSEWSWRPGAIRSPRLSAPRTTSSHSQHPTLTRRNKLTLLKYSSPSSIQRTEGIAQMVTLQAHYSF